MKSPSAQRRERRLPYLLGDVHFGITPDGENFDKGIGTGAFILEEFQPGVRTLAKRNPNYWDPERGHVDLVETVAFNDKSARVAALLSKSVHVVNNVESRVAQRLKGQQGITLHTEADPRSSCLSAAPTPTLQEYRRQAGFEIRHRP
uniref:ABC transporter substrate-binding protein n=1 Tax=Agrobacterium fabrum TaxID=1176649 RepID=UPI0021BD2735|nr:ABC transporter substrate-binding protein [Agrobacterium fabrum]